jgi:hypothetical protein
MEAQEIRVQKTLTDLATLDDVLLVKSGTFTPVVDAAEALARLGNDSAALQEVINDGLKARAMQELRQTAGGWHTFKKDDTGEDTDEVNGPFEGQVGDSKKINVLVLTLAKSVFGFEKSMSKEQKAAAKEAARSMIKSTPAIKDGLSKTAALTAEED